jgi:hypothetical protein
MGETRWGRTFFWLASVGGAVAVGVLLVLLLVPIAIPLVVPILFAGLGGLVVLLTVPRPRGSHSRTEAGCPHPGPGVDEGVRWS